MNTNVCGYFFTSDIAGLEFKKDASGEASIYYPPVRYVKYDYKGELSSPILETSDYTVVDIFNTTNNLANKWSNGGY